MRSKSANRRSNRRSKRRRNPRAGFTLIETMAALAIAAAVFAVIAEFAGRTLRNWNYGEGTISTMEMVTRGIGRLQTDLTLALPMTPPGTDGSSVYFTGDGQRMLFVAATGFGLGDRGVELLNVSVSGEGDDLYLTRRRAPVSNPPQQFRDPVVLLHGRMQARFIYLDDKGKAYETWVNKPVLPSAVAVEVNVPQRGPLFPRPLILPIPVNFDIDCLAGDENDDKPPRCEQQDEPAPKPQLQNPNVPGQPPRTGQRAGQ
jgi:general secretion pathway protein J